MRVLYEIAHGNSPTASDIGRALELDAGYLSRVLRNFEKRGWSGAPPRNSDARQSHLRCRRKGAETFAPLEARSQRDTAAMLGRLAPQDQTRLIAAMSTIETLLGGAAPTALGPPLYAARAGAGRFRLDRQASRRALRAGISLDRTVRRSVRADRRRLRQRLRSGTRALLDCGNGRRECRHRDAGERQSRVARRPAAGRSEGARALASAPASPTNASVSPAAPATRRSRYGPTACLRRQGTSMRCRLQAAAHRKAQKLGPPVVSEHWDLDL